MKKVFGQNLAYLRAKKGLNQSEIADIIGISGATWSDYERGKTEPNFSVLGKISEFFRVGINTLITETINDAHPTVQEKEEIEYGKSTPKRTPNRTPKEENWQVRTLIHTVEKGGRENIVLVPVKAQAGYLMGSQQTEFVERLPTFWMPGLNHGTFRAFEVAGYSMFIEKGAGFNPGDIVIGEYVENPREIRDGQVYIIVNNAGEVDDIVLKRCLNRLDTPDGKIWCKSDNKDPQYATFPLALDQIKEVWRFKRKITAQAPDPSGIFERLNDLESRLNEMDLRYRKMLDK